MFIEIVCRELSREETLLFMEIYDSIKFLIGCAWLLINDTHEKKLFSPTSSVCTTVELHSNMKGTLI